MSLVFRLLSQVCKIDSLRYQMLDIRTVATQLLELIIVVTVQFILATDDTDNTDKWINRRFAY
jgi:hypothetical protein